MSEFTDISVTVHNIFRESYALSYTYREVRLFEVFRSKEEAEFWAEKLKTGEWDPSETSPTKALRKALEGNQ